MFSVHWNTALESDPELRSWNSDVLFMSVKMETKKYMFAQKLISEAKTNMSKSW